MVRKYKSKKRKYSKRIKKHLRSHKRKRSMKKRREGGSGGAGPRRGNYESSIYVYNPNDRYWSREYDDNPGDTIYDDQNAFDKDTGKLVRPRPSPTKSSTKSLIGKKKSRPTIYGPCKICRKGKGNCTKRGRPGHLKKKKH